MTPPLKSKPIRTALAWQALATVAIAALAGVWAGGHAALSAALGGMVTLSSIVVYAFVLGIGQTASAGASVGPPQHDAAEALELLGVAAVEQGVVGEQDVRQDGGAHAGRRIGTGGPFVAHSRPSNRLPSPPRTEPSSLRLPVCGAAA